MIIEKERGKKLAKPKTLIAGTCLSIFLLIVTAACGAGSNSSNNNSAQYNSQQSQSDTTSVDVSNMPTLETCSVGDGTDFATTYKGHTIEGTGFPALCTQHDYAVVTALVENVQGVTVVYPIVNGHVAENQQCGPITGPRGVPPASGALYVFSCGTRVVIIYEDKQSTKPLVLEGDLNTVAQASFSSDGYNITISYQPSTCPDQCVLFATDK